MSEASVSFAPVYLRQTANDLTGEHTCAMLRVLETSLVDKSWLGAYCRDFSRRFMALLGYKQFQTFAAATALSLLQSAKTGAALESVEPRIFDKVELDRLFTSHDVARLESYASGYYDYHAILDLVPTLATLYFGDRLSSVKLATLEKPILLSVGLQRKDLEDVFRDLGIASAAALAIFSKLVKKLAAHFAQLVNADAEQALPPREMIVAARESAQGVHDDAVDERFEPLQADLAEELEEEGGEAVKELRRKQREMIDSLPLDQ